MFGITTVTLVRSSRLKYFVNVQVLEKLQLSWRWSAGFHYFLSDSSIATLSGSLWFNRESEHDVTCIRPIGSLCVSDLPHRTELHLNQLNESSAFGIHSHSKVNVCLPFSLLVPPPQIT